MVFGILESFSGQARLVVHGRGAGLAAAFVLALMIAAPGSQALAQTACVGSGANQICTNPAGSALGAITDTGSPTITNLGGISGILDGIFANQNATVTNSGTISGTDDGINIHRDAAVTNSGTISGGGLAGIQAINATVTNSGAVSGVEFGVLVLNTAIVANTGTISGSLLAGIESFNGSATVTNSGTILTGRAGIQAVNAIVTNSGTISARDFGIGANIAAVINSGTISGGTGVSIFGGGSGSALINSGVIIGTGGTAVDFSLSSADSLTFLPGSRVVGQILLGANDTVTARGPLSALLTFGNGAGGNGLVATGSQFASTAPFAVNGNQVATLDPTALAQADRALMDFTGGVSSLVQGRLNGLSSSSSPSAASSAGMMAIGYAPEDAQANLDANAKMFTKAPVIGYQAAPITVWANGFGGQRVQDATDATLRATSTAYGGVLGLDRQVRPDWLVGAFVGGGAGRLAVDQNAQTVDSDYVFGGAYNHFARGAQFLDVTVQGGNTTNNSTRQVGNNLAAGGLENARASYNGWFVSPEVAYGYRIAIGHGYVLTPTARARYVAGLFDGYAESGSAQNLTVGARTLQDVEERGELNLSRVSYFFGGDHLLTTQVHGGVIALQRLGDANINTVLIGQSLSFVTPGHGSAVGAVAGVGFDYHTSKNVALFGAIEAVAMSDQSRTGTARGGFRVAF
jgi:uncharacterized protein with beta-barrel porin domain